MPIAVEIRHSRVERRGKLRLRWQWDGLEFPAAVEEDVMVQRRGLEALRRLEGSAEDGRERGVRVGGKGPHAKPHRWYSGHQLAERRERGDAAYAVVILGFDHVPLPGSAEGPVIQEERMGGVDVVFRVPTPARCDNIEATVPVQIPGRHPIPAPHDPVEAPGSRSVVEAPVIV